MTVTCYMDRGLQICTEKAGWLARIFVIMLLWCLVPRGVYAQTDSIPVMKDSMRVLLSQRENLLLQQKKIKADVDRLAEVVDSLKQRHAGGAASGRLANVLRQSLEMTLNLEQLYRDENQVGRQVEKVRDALRLAYDAEIDQLIVNLQASPDSETVLRLNALRSERRALTEATVLRPLPTVSIEEEDTPDDIQMKADLMLDVAKQLQKEKDEAGRQLKRLVNEQRLRARMSAFANEFGLFDEASAQGRSVTPGAIADLENDRAEPSAPPEFDIAGIAPTESEDKTTSEIVENGRAAVDLGREISLDNLSGNDLSPSDELGLEIQRLRQQQTQLTDQEQMVRERVMRLQRYLEQLLEGQVQ